MIVKIKCVFCVQIFSMFINDFLDNENICFDGQKFIDANSVNGV